MYLGCYADQESRNLKGDFKDFTNGLTPQLCMDHCKDRGFPFAGVQFRFVPITSAPSPARNKIYLNIIQVRNIEYQKYIQLLFFYLLKWSYH